MPGNSNYGRPQGVGCCGMSATIVFILTACLIAAILRLFGLY